MAGLSATCLFLLAAPIEALIMAALPPALLAGTTFMSKPSHQPEEPSFEDAIQRLDEIVAGMEESQLSLEEMISSYEEGVRLLKLCRQRIDGARRRVEVISGDLEGGKASLAPFDSDSSEDSPLDTGDKSRSSTRRHKTADSEGGEIRLF